MVLYVRSVTGDITEELRINQRLNCAFFVTQQDAQALFDSFPSTFAYLDKDNDQLACEHLP